MRVILTERSQNEWVLHRAVIQGPSWVNAKPPQNRLPTTQQIQEVPMLRKGERKTTVCRTPMPSVVLTQLAILLLLFTSCTTTRVRDRFNDPQYRVMVLADRGVPESTYVQVQTALIETNRFFVVDRARGFRAIKAEQNLIHKLEGDRFDDPEKFSWYGKMYSVGALIVPSEQCFPVSGFFIRNKRIDCRQYLTAIDTSTGEVITAVQYLAEGEGPLEKPTWDEALDKLVKAFPVTWEPKRYDKRMEEFRLATAENARRAKEALANDELEQESDPDSFVVVKRHRLHGRGNGN